MRSRLVTGACAAARREQHLVEVGELQRRGRRASHVARLAPSASSAASSSAVGGRPTIASLDQRRRRARPSTSSLVRPDFTDRGCSSGSQPAHGVLVVLVQQQPLLLAAAVPPRAHEDEPAAQLLAVRGRSAARRPRPPASGSSPVAGLPRAPVPHDHVAAAVLAARDDALEVEVVERVVLDVHRQAPDVGVERRALRHRPADQHAVDLEAEVVVQAAGPVALDDEPVTVARRRRRCAAPARACDAKSRLARYRSRRSTPPTPAGRDRCAFFVDFFAGTRDLRALAGRLLACRLLPSRRLLGTCRFDAALERGHQVEHLGLAAPSPRSSSATFLPVPLAVIRLRSSSV